MPEICSCGAEVLPESRFCHKCGRPLREEAIVVEAAPSPIPVVMGLPSETVALLHPSFHNPIAIRVGLLAASIATLLNLVLIYGFVIWLVAAGFFSAYLFNRRTGQFLTIRAGARMGWITGILSFVILTVLFTISILSIASQSGGMAAFYRQQMGSTPDANMEQALRLLETANGQIMLFVVSLLFLFTVVTVFCAAGGALGAKVLEKE